MVTLHQSPALIIQLIQIPVNGSFAFYLFLFISHRLILISKVQQCLTNIEHVDNEIVLIWLIINHLYVCPPVVNKSTEPSCTVKQLSRDF